MTAFRLQRQLDTLPNLIAARLALSQSSMDPSRRESAVPTSRNTLVLRSGRPSRAYTVSNPDALLPPDTNATAERQRASPDLWDPLATQDSLADASVSQTSWQPSRDVSSEQRRATSSGSPSSPTAQYTLSTQRPAGARETQETSFTRDSPQPSHQGTQSRMVYRGRSSQA